MNFDFDFQNSLNNKKKEQEQILNDDQRYCNPGPNQVRFISEKQTLSVILGSCISTVFIGKNKHFVLAANHIVIANPRPNSHAASKSALQQVDEIIDIFKKVYGIYKEKLICLHLVGAGQRLASIPFSVNEDNIKGTELILKEKNFKFLFKDTNSYFHCTYSISGSSLSIFVEDKIEHTHKSFIIDLDKLFQADQESLPSLPVAALVANRGFERMVHEKIITTITGKI
ncbi:MAG: hypothetical protein GY754_03515 [bacterium]|nr:hypothetical protein [bacterium]